MGRDRLPELLKKCNLSNESIPIEEINDKEYSSDVMKQMENIENFLPEYTEIVMKLRNLQSNLDEMTRMTQQTNLVNFDENELNTIRSENLKLGQQLIIKFDILKLNLPTFMTTENRMKKCLYFGLQKNFIIIWHRNEEFLVIYETKVKKQFLRQLKILNLNATEEEVEELMTNNHTDFFVSNILAESENERRKLKDLMERHSELQKLERSIRDVHALFLRVQNLVLDQGEKIQQIEHHVQESEKFVTSGAIETDKAEKLKKKALKKKTCLIIFGVVLLVILILFVVL